MYKFIKLCFVLVLVLLYTEAKAQLSVTDAGLDGSLLGSNLAGENIVVTNASVSGDIMQSGTFTFIGDDLGVNSGVILSTGNINFALGPNQSQNTSTGYGGPGNALLTELAESSTHDAVVLQFDFEVQTDMIEFNYVFLSEEYNEFVNTGFNDVFAFYISGPGIDGEENLAVVPGTTTPVSINTINNETFWQFYVDNEYEPFAANIEFDGFTTLMKAQKTGLIPCETYTLKLMIADAGDSAYDAAVLLQENSLIQADVSATANTFSENDIALEGCIEASFTFQLEEALEDDVEIPIEIAGTAINGVDYEHIDNVIVIPAGQTSATVVINYYGDGLTEGQETIELIFVPEPCQEPDTVTLYIDDYNLIEFTTSPTDLTCNGDGTGGVSLTLSGGLPPYYITLTDSITNESELYTTNPVENLEAGTYYVEVLDGYGCSAEDIVYGNMFDGGPVFIPDGTGLSYETTINISGFGTGQTLSSVDQIESICMNMEHSRIGELEILLQAPDGSQIVLKQQPGGAVTNMGEPCAIGPADAGNDDTSPGIGYDYCFTADPTYGTMVEMANVNSYTYITQCYGTEESDKYLPEGSYEPYQSLAGLVGVPLNGDWKLIITDEIPNNNGWIFNWSISLSADQPDSVFTIVEPILPEITYDVIQPECGLSNGSIDITVSGDSSPYDFEWSNGEFTEDITGLSSGDYTVTITGADMCQYVYTYNLSSNGSLAVTSDIENTSCHDGNDGSIQIYVAGASEPLNINWSNLEDTELIENLEAGQYTVTVTDAASCMSIETYEIESPLLIAYTESITDENCGDGEGIVSLTITGGTEPYTVDWSNGDSGLMTDELSAGRYYFTITDSEFCEVYDSVDIVNYVGNCVPDCDIAITNYFVENEICGNSNGSIDLTVFTSNPPFSAEWSNWETTTDISGLYEGEYTVTFTDAENCELIETYNITNEAGTLDIISVSSFNEYCGQTDGSINITVSGGALPYSYNWSNGETTEDLTDIPAGNYSVTVTDGNYCSVVTSTAITNETTGLNYVWGNAVNEICGNGNGSIDIIIEGIGVLDYDWSSGQISEDLMNISEGTYQCTVTDQYGCAITTPEFVVENEAGTLNIDNIDVDNEICGNAIGEIEVFVSGGATPYDYTWSNGGDTYIIENLSAGTYSATISDMNGCAVATGNIQLLNETGTLELSEIILTDEICNNSMGAINISLNGGLSPYEYLWSNSSTSEDLQNVSAGDYSCTITDQNGCEIDFSTTVEENMGTLALQNIITIDETCGAQDGSAQVVITGGTAPIIYDWSNSESTALITDLAAGNYSCTITDDQGCEIFAETNIENISGDLQLTGQVITNETCGDNNGSIELTVSGSGTPIEYDWSNFETSSSISGLSSGDYTCTITDSYMCEIVAGPYTINSFSGGFTVSDVIVTNEACNSGNGSIDITISCGVEPITYEWSSGQDTEGITDLSAGVYYYTVTDANCVISGSAEVINDAGDLSLDGYITTNEICTNGTGSIDITVSGGLAPYDFAWSNLEVSEDLDNLSAGTYTVTITDQNSCEIVSNNITISNNPGTFSLVDINVTDEQCEDGSGEIDVILSGGTNPITYNWNSGGFSQDLTGLNSGTYYCTATDANSCELVYSAIVNNNSGNMEVSYELITDETCGDNNGAIDIEIVGGTEPYNYLWSNNETSQDLADINSGDYTCIINDDLGCSIVYHATVNGNSEGFQISNVIITDETCSLSNGSIDITIANGAEPLMYQWNEIIETQDIYNIEAGTYVVTVTDFNMCTVSGTYVVDNIISDLSIDNLVVTDENCGQANGAIDMAYSGSSNPIEISWSNGDDIEYITDLSSGWYYVTLSDAMGCQVTDAAFVENITNGFELASSIETDEYCGASDGSIDLTVTGGIEPITFEWNSGQDTEDISGLAAGYYECTISDDVDCSFIYSYTIINETNGLEIVSAETTNDICSTGVGAIDLTVTGGTEPYEFIWSNDSTTEDLTGITTGEYTVTITDNTSCAIFSDVITVGSDDNEDLGFEYIYINNATCGNSNGQIMFYPIGGSDYHFFLNGVQTGNTNIGNLEAGEYILTIESQGCTVDSLLTIENSTPYTLAISNIQDEICGDGTGSIDLLVSPTQAYTYIWSNDTYNQDANGLSAGTYTCTVSDDDACQSIISAEVNNITGFTVSSTTFNDICMGGTGSIDLEVADAIGLVNYIWNTDDETQDISGLYAGEYSCTITDETTCQFIYNTEILNETGDLEINSVIEHDYCNYNQGFIELNITGGSGNYDIEWSDESTETLLENLGAGTYSVTVIDIDEYCTFTDTYIIENGAAFSVNELITPASCQTCPDGEIDLTTSGGGPNLDFVWSNDEYTEDIVGLLPGEYTVTVTNNWDCEQVLTFTVGFIVNAELQTMNQLQVYPNPADNIIYIETENSINANIELYNMLGEVILMTKIDSDLKTIDISSYKPGLYFIRLSNSEIDERIKLVIK